MGKTYQRADEATAAMVKSAMSKWHPTLLDAGVTVDALMVADFDPETGEVFPALKHGGYQAAATIKANNLQLRVLDNADALLVIDTCNWDRLGEAERVALIDHELTHLLVVMDQGSIRRDDHGRPRLKMRLHDWQLGGFTAVARRHGEKAPEVQAVRQCREGDQYFWDFTGPELRAVGE